MKHRYPRKPGTAGQLRRVVIVGAAAALAGTALVPAGQAGSASQTVALNAGYGPGGARIAGSQPAPAGKPMVEESFRDGTVRQPELWDALSTAGAYPPCLTAATQSSGSLQKCKNGPTGKGDKPDKAGQGAFQLTNADKDEAGALLLDKPLPAQQGLRAEFDLFQFNGAKYKERYGDGISFFFVDGREESIKPGGSGGSLGYAGMPGGFVGIGFDRYGNFSNPAKSGKGGPGQQPSRIVIRGADSTGYRYIDSVDVKGKLGPEAKVTNREAATRHFAVDLSPAGLLDLTMDANDGTGPRKVLDDVDLNALPGQPAMPPVIKMGFSGSTGLATDRHELRGFKLTTLPPDLWLKTGGSVTVGAGGTGSFDLTVGNSAGAGPTTGDVTVRYEAPPGLVPKGASGDGWTCQTDGQAVTCKRSGKDPLAPGKTYPPVKVEFTAEGSADGKLTGKASVTTPGDSDPSDSSVDVGINVDPLTGKGPNLALKVTGDETVKPGGSGNIDLSVANAKDAGPTKGDVTVTYAVPPQLDVTDTVGEGWTCTLTVDKKSLNCTRPGAGQDALLPGQSYPSIRLRVTAKAGTGGQAVPGKVTVGTEGETDPSDNAATADLKIEAEPPAKGPNLWLRATGETDLPVGGSGAIDLSVGNAAGAGPTTGEVSLTYQVPDGLTVKSATGAGWKCTVGKTVKCTRPGSGADALGPGLSYGPVRLAIVAGPDAEGVLHGKATTGTEGEADPTDNDVMVDIHAEKQPQAKGPDLSGRVTTVDPKVVAGGSGALDLVVSNAAEAGPTNAEVRVDWSLPNELRADSAAGDGWKCSVDGHSVTCLRPGTGADQLEPGESYPPISITAFADSAALGKVSGRTGISTEDELNPDDNYTPFTVTIAPPPKAPELSLGVDGATTIPAGGTGTVNLTVSDAKSAGPTDGEVVVTYPVPKGLTAKSATGKGWECAIEGQNVTCTRPGKGADELKPGASYPPIAVTLEAGAGTSGAVTSQAAVTTPGQSHPGHSSAEVSLTVTPESGKETGLKIDLTSKPSPWQPGKPFTYTLTVSNDGPAPATGARVTAQLPPLWGRILWSCKATEGSKCPDLRGTFGNLDSKVDLAPGGSVTFTIECAMPATLAMEMKAVATVTPPAGVTDPNCAADKCRDDDVNFVARR